MSELEEQIKEKTRKRNLPSGRFISQVPFCRFWERVKVLENECWEWLGGCNNKYGYGIFWTGKRKQVAHRYLYELIKGEVPAELELDHLCRNPKCVNPDHLEAVTHQVNCQRGKGGEKTAILKQNPKRLYQLI